MKLTAYSIGNAPEYLAEEGLENALYYFELNGLDIQECFEAYVQYPDSIQGKHWVTANEKANFHLLGKRMYDNSMIFLEME